MGSAEDSKHRLLAIIKLARDRSCARKVQDPVIENCQEIGRG